MGQSAILRGPTPWSMASDVLIMGPHIHVSSTKPWTMALWCAHGAGDHGVMFLCLEPRRVALQKRLFCEIFSRTDYFVLKFAIKVNLVKIVPP
jgi:hypothetical protein